MSDPTRNFPAVEARSLDKKDYLLPSELGGELNLLAVAFDRNHQKDVDSWADDFAAAEKRGLCSYEIPTISKRWRPARGFIDGGMAAAIGDREILARTLTIYDDVGRVQQSLGLPDRSEIAVIVCDRDGMVQWFHRGARTEEAAEELAKISAPE